MSQEDLVIGALLNDEEYMRKTYPFLREEYFTSSDDRILFRLIKEYVDKYGKAPMPEVLQIELDNLSNISSKDYEAARQKINSIKKPAGELVWLVDQTERFCQDKSLYNAISKAIQIIDGGEKQLSRTAIPSLLEEALSVSFDTAVGHDYIADAEGRFNTYHEKTVRVETHLEIFNMILKGGFPNKTLNIFMASTGVGKSMIMCDLAAHQLLRGYNVLYITLEMAEERIAERIDANLLDVTLDELRELPRDSYFRRMDKLKAKATGRLVIKEYPTTSAGANNFRYLVNELRQKKNFRPDIIYIDYLNICASSRLKMGNNVNSYLYIKSIAEELRGLAVELNLPIVSATQTNRGGYENSDIGLDDTSDSFGLPMTVDFMLALMSDENLEAMGQILAKQLKNRYTDADGKYKRFVMGREKAKMRFYDLEESAQKGLMTGSSAPAKKSFDRKPKQEEDKPVFDRGAFARKVSGAGAVIGSKVAEFNFD